MIKNGALKFENDKNRKIECLFCITHGSRNRTWKNWDKVWKGTCFISKNTPYDNGTSAHAALPHKGVDAILIGAKSYGILAVNS